MLRIEIQKGAAKDAVVIANLIKKMVLEMEQYAGHAINESPAVWSSVEIQVRANTTRKD